MALREIAVEPSHRVYAVASLPNLPAFPVRGERARSSGVMLRGRVVYVAGGGSDTIHVTRYLA